MLVCPADGLTLGSISGGCLEADVVDQANAVLVTGEPLILTYDTTSESDILWGFGLGCNGVVKVLIERLEPGDPFAPLNFVADCVRRRASGVLARVIHVEKFPAVPLGASLMLRDGQPVVHNMAHEPLARLVAQDASEVLRDQCSKHRNYPLAEGACGVFLELIRPPLPLLIFGAGHDAVPLTRFARELGWHVTVVDHRPAFATAERFPKADVVIVARPSDVSEDLIDDKTATVVMTHHYLHDLALLRMLFRSPARYIGLVGPRQRRERLLADLRRDGSDLSVDQLQRLHAPVGLDLGAESPEEVALAIAAEVKAVLGCRSGGLLRERAGAIHDQASATAFATESSVTPHRLRSAADG